MNEGKRPGGLTALAVLNFVLAGFALLSILGMIVLLALFTMTPEHMNDAQRTQWEAIQEMGRPWLVISMVLSAVSGVLLLLSGIGYLKQRKFLGRVLGNIYAVVAIISNVVSAVIMTPEIGGGFSIGVIIGLIYPLLTLILLNTTFKEDLTN